MAELTCVVVTPESTVLDEKSEFVVVPLFDGELGVGKSHSPMIGRLGYGPLRIRQPGGETHRFYVDGGFVQVLNNVVTILTNRAVPVDQIDVEAARTQLADARQRPISTPEELEIRERLSNQARAQLRMAGHSFN